MQDGPSGSAALRTSCHYPWLHPGQVVGCLAAASRGSGLVGVGPVALQQRISPRPKQRL